MDVREISSEASLGLFMDMLAGEKSIARRVFGILFSFSSLLIKIFLLFYFSSTKMSE